MSPAIALFSARLCIMPTACLAFFRSFSSSSAPSLISVLLLSSNSFADSSSSIRRSSSKLPCLASALLSTTNLWASWCGCALASDDFGMGSRRLGQFGLPLLRLESGSHSLGTNNESSSCASSALCSSRLLVTSPPAASQACLMIFSVCKCVSFGGAPLESHLFPPGARRHTCLWIPGHLASDIWFPPRCATVWMVSTSLQVSSVLRLPPSRTRKTSCRLPGPVFRVVSSALCRVASDVGVRLHGGCKDCVASALRGCALVRPLLTSCFRLARSPILPSWVAWSCSKF